MALRKAMYRGMKLTISWIESPNAWLLSGEKDQPPNDDL